MPTFFGIDIGVSGSLKVVDHPADAPLPRPQRSPVVRFPGLALVGQADDAGSQLVVVGLDACRDDTSIAPAFGDGKRLPGGHEPGRPNPNPNANSIMIGTGFFVSAGTVKLAWMLTAICG